MVSAIRGVVTKQHSRQPHKQRTSVLIVPVPAQTLHSTMPHEVAAAAKKSDQCRCK